MEQSYSRMCGLQRKTFQVNGICLSSQSESNLLQPHSLTPKTHMHQMYFTLEHLSAVDLTQKLNPDTIKARVSQPVSVWLNSPIGPLVTASCSD